MLEQNGDKSDTGPAKFKTKGTMECLALIHSVQRNAVTYFTYARISAQKGTPNKFQQSCLSQVAMTRYRTTRLLFFLSSGRAH